MSFTTIHPTAIFEEGFILVGVDFEDVQDFGEKEIFEAIQNHDWIIKQDIPVIIVYQDEEEDLMRAYGDTDLVEAVTKMTYDDIIWGHELNLEWDDDDFEDLDDDDDEFDDFDEFDDDLVDDFDDFDDGFNI